MKWLRGEWGNGDHLRKFINIFIWNWFFSQISYRDIQYRIIALKKTIKTRINLIKFIYRYKKI